MAAVLAAFLCALYAAAQTTPNRVTAPIDENHLVVLGGNVHPLAQGRFDRGAAPASTPTGRIRLALQRSAGQQQALTQFLSDVQNPGSAVYHKWLTPAQYGAQFGISDADLARVTAWLESHGFKIEKVPAARNVIEFSGNFEQMQSAFHTAMHAFSIQGETHVANIVDPQIPAALAPVVAGVGPLNDFRPRPTMALGPRGRFDPSTGRIEPELTLKGGNTDYLFVDPADASTIYDTPNKTLNSTYTGSSLFDGSGVNLGVVGVSDLVTQDVANYRMAFLGETISTVHLPTVVVDGSDPGINGAAVEALLDNEVAGGIAPKANIYFYTSADTDLSSGLFNAMYRAIDDNVVSIISMSFGNCEAALGTQGNQSILEWAEQAAAQGITVTVSTGDNGSAGCDNFDVQSVASGGLAVSGFASTPYNIAVGGTDFDVLSTSFPTYVSTTSSGTGPYYGTALKYIPEEPWNDSTTVNTTYQNNVAYKNVGGTGGNIIAGSGGVSTVYPKPSFQSSLTPSDGGRDLPDVSFLAGNAFYRAAWVICGDSTAYGAATGTFSDCQMTNGQFTSSTSFGGVGGTSAAAPAFAAMMALVAQAHGSAADNYRLGQADNVLYLLAKSKYSTVFHDITTGNNSVPCSAGSPNCSGGNSFLAGYNASTGYDLATGLGSVDVAALVSNWGSVSPGSTSTTLKINGSTADYTGVHGVSLKFDVSVNPSTATGVAGLVDNANETADGNQNNGQLPIPLASGAGSAMYNGLPGGSYRLWARYGGDTANAASTSTPPIHITISPEPSTIMETVAAYDWATGFPVGTGNIPYGSLIFVDSQIAGTAEGNNTQGVATGTVTFTDGSATVGTVPVNSGNLASLISAVGEFRGGTHSVVASYPGDPSYGKSTSAPVNFTVTPLKTTMTSQVNPSNLSAGGSTTVVFTGSTALTPGVPPTGTVTASLGNTALESTSSFSISSGSNGAGFYLDFSGNFTLNSSQLSPGVNTVTVAYGGDTDYSPSSSTIQIDSIAPGGGPVVTVPANITTGPGGALYPLGLSSTGDYTGFLSWSCSPNPVNSLASCSVYTSHVPLTGSIDTLLTVGVDSTTAGTYTVDLSGSDNSGGASVSKTIMVTGTSTNSPSLIVVNDGTFNVAAGSSTGNTSYVTIFPEQNLTGQVNLTCAVTTTMSNPQSPPTCTAPTSVTLDGSSPVVAQVQVNTTSRTTAGNYSVGITATSSSTASATSSNSVPLIVTTTPSFALTSSGTVTVIRGASTGNTTSITITPMNGFSGPVNLACMVEPAATMGAGTIPVCSVQSPLNVSGGTASNATATINSQASDMFGFYQVTIIAIDQTSGTFGIDNNVDLLLVGTPAFTLSSGAGISVTAGATTGNTSSITVTPANGFTGAINLTCSVTTVMLTVVDPPGCSLSPAAVTVSSSSSLPGSTLAVSTTAATSGAVVPASRPSRLPGAVATLAIMLLLGIGARRRAWMRLLGLLVLLVWIAAPGCGGGGGSGGGGGGGGTGTTPGNYTIMVTGTDAATGKITAQTKVTLAVN